MTVLPDIKQMREGVMSVEQWGVNANCAVSEKRGNVKVTSHYRTFLMCQEEDNV